MYFYNMKIGYERVSMIDQNPDMQTDALKAYGCEQIFSEKISGRKRSRPELDKMLSLLRKGDTLVVWRINRLGRNLKDLIDISDTLKEQGVELVSLDGKVDTTTSTGRFFFQLMAVFAEYEVEQIRERTIAGLQAARSRGRVGGRPKGLSPMFLQKEKIAKALYADKDNNNMSVKEIMQSLGIKSKTSFYKIINHNK